MTQTWDSTHSLQSYHNIPQLQNGKSLRPEGTVSSSARSPISPWPRHVVVAGFALTRPDLDQSNLLLKNASTNHTAE